MHGCVWLIAGPTASGKSDLALRLAQATGGEIINADSMQIYRDLSVLSARPSPDDAKTAPHHLYGVVDGAERWSAGRWLKGAQAVLAEIAERGRPAVVVGGTGLYFRALTQGLAQMPDVPDEAVRRAQSLWSEGGEAAVRLALVQHDPQTAAAIAKGDRQRLIRALAVADGTGRPLSGWRAKSTPVLDPAVWRGVLLEVDRAALYARCDARLQAMVHGGALGEVKALLARGLDPELPISKAVGVREFGRYLKGEIALDLALVQAQQATRHYVKRQLTWFRHQTPDWLRLTDIGPGAVERLLKRETSPGSPGDD